MLFITVIERDERAFKDSFYQAVSYKDAYIEVRLDALDVSIWNRIEECVRPYKERLLATFRSEEEGGFATNSSEERKEAFLKIDRWKWKFIDLEISKDRDLLPKLKSQVLLSSHTKTCVDPHMKKWAFYPEKIEDLFEGISRCHGLCYTPLGLPYQGWRLLSYLLGKGFLFCALNTQKAIFGQPTIDELLQLYRIHQNPLWIYALLGSPIEASLSHQLHNKWFIEDERSAIYLKLEVKKGQIATFLDWARSYPFAGFSVTMPHKEEVCAYLAKVDYPLPVVNTLLRTSEGWVGYNTDGISAIELLLKEIPHLKKIAIFGAGGSAQAIAYEAKKRGIDVVLWGRNKERTIDVANKLGVRSADTIEIVAQESWDAMIQATPCGMQESDPLPFDLELFRQHPQYPLIFDIISVPEQTKLLKKAHNLGHKTITGRAMLLRQAELQRELFKKAEMCSV